MTNHIEFDALVNAMLVLFGITVALPIYFRHTRTRLRRATWRTAKGPVSPRAFNISYLAVSLLGLGLALLFVRSWSSLKVTYVTVCASLAVLYAVNFAYESLRAKRDGGSDDSDDKNKPSKA